MLLWWLGIGEDAEDLGGRRPLSSGHGVGMAKRGGKVPSMGGLEKEETRKKKLRARTNPRSSVGGTTDVRRRTLQVHHHHRLRRQSGKGGRARGFSLLVHNAMLLPPPELGVRRWALQRGKGGRGEGVRGVVSPFGERRSDRGERGGGFSLLVAMRKKSPRGRVLQVHPFFPRFTSSTVARSSSSSSCMRPSVCRCCLRSARSDCRCYFRLNG